jgi:hypothetical protein
VRSSGGRARAPGRGRDGCSPGREPEARHRQARRSSSATPACSSCRSRRWRFPYLRWILSTPEYHHWHHTSDEEGIDKNFASFLPLWDFLFGTLHLPDHWPKNYGTVKFQPPEDYAGQLLYPFRRKGEATPYGQPRCPRENRWLAARERTR